MLAFPASLGKCLEQCSCQPTSQNLMSKKIIRTDGGREQVAEREREKESTLHVVLILESLQGKPLMEVERIKFLTSSESAK